VTQLERYSQRVTLPDEGDGDEGEWVMCACCEQSWRPGTPTRHEADCPVAELERLDAQEARELTALEVWNAPCNYDKGWSP